MGEESVRVWTSDMTARRRWAVVVGAAVAVVVAVASTVLLLEGPLGDTPPTAGGGPEQPGRSALPEGWRWESWRDVSFVVPEGWGYGVLHQTGCDRKARPVVERPGGVSTAMWCPQIGYGVALSEDADPYPDVVPHSERVEADTQTFRPGAVVRRTTVGDVALVVTAPDRATAQRVAESAHRFEGEDPNGCPARMQVPALGDFTGGVDPARLARASLCRYVTRDSGPNLHDSAALSASPSRELADALSSAPAGRGPDARREDCIDWPEDEAVLVQSGHGPVVWVHYAGCRGHGIDFGGRTARLTEHVMEQLLATGWSWEFAGSVPLPREGGR